MHRHGPSCLQGPASRERHCWQDITTTPIGQESVPQGLSLPLHRPEEAPLRFDLIERIRREIAEGTYDTPEKWEAALDRFLDHWEENSL